MIKIASERGRNVFERGGQWRTKKGLQVQLKLRLDCYFAILYDHKLWYFIDCIVYDFCVHCATFGIRHSKACIVCSMSQIILCDCFLHFYLMWMQNWKTHNILAFSSFCFIMCEIFLLENAGSGFLFGFFPFFFSVNTEHTMVVFTRSQSIPNDFYLFFSFFFFALLQFYQNSIYLDFGLLNHLGFDRICIFRIK